MNKQSAEELSPDMTFNKFLIIGPPGSGKSRFATTCPTPGFVWDFSKGIVLYKKKKFEYVQYPISSQGWVEFEKDFREFDKEMRDGVSPYKTVILDDTTGMDNLCMERALALDPKRNAAQGPLWNVHYQLVRNLIEGKIRRMVSWPCNLVIITHIDIIQDQDTGAVIDIAPLLTGKLSKIIPGFFDEVYYTFTKREAGETKWYLQTVPIGLKMARSRLSGTEHSIPDFIENDYNSLMEKLIEAQK